LKFNEYSMKTIEYSLKFIEFWGVNARIWVKITQKPVCRGAAA